MQRIKYHQKLNRKKLRNTSLHFSFFEFIRLRVLYALCGENFFYSNPISSGFKRFKTTGRS
jgi:hypothetical protein